jgi:hypothetical protein
MEFLVNKTQIFILNLYCSNIFAKLVFELFLIIKKTLKMPGAIV